MNLITVEYDNDLQKAINCPIGELYYLYNFNRALLGVGYWGREKWICLPDLITRYDEVVFVIPFWKNAPKVRRRSQQATIEKVWQLTQDQIGVHEIGRRLGLSNLTVQVYQSKARQLYDLPPLRNRTKKEKEPLLEEEPLHEDHLIQAVVSPPLKVVESAPIQAKQYLDLIWGGEFHGSTRPSKKKEGGA